MIGLVLFAEDCRNVALFYSALLGVPAEEEAGSRYLRSATAEVQVIQIPPEFLAGDPSASSAAPRVEAAFKPSFEVDSLESALTTAVAHGGEGTGRWFSDQRHDYLDIVDCEGNVIQLRCRRPVTLA